MLLNTDHLKRGASDSAPRNSATMPAPPTLSLALPQKYLQQVQSLLRTHVPQAEVWACGSRVTGSVHEASDLDLLRNPKNLREETSAQYKLKEAFTESTLPIRVAVMDSARTPASFQRETERVHVVEVKK